MRRLTWLVAGIALLGFAVYEVVVHEMGALPIVGFLILPDLAFLIAVGQPHQRGQLPGRAVPAYNLMHRPMLPIVVIAIALVWLLAVRLLVQDPLAFEPARAIPLVVYVAGITWLAHIALDRAAGFGLRTADGWQRR